MPVIQPHDTLSTIKGTLVFIMGCLLLAESCCSSSALAFYQPPSAAPFFFYDEQQPPAEQIRPGCFTILDPAQRLAPQQTRFLFPRSDFYVPGYSLEITQRLTGISSPPLARGEDPIANLLYANLRLKKILDDYRDIQDRAKTLFADQNMAAAQTITQDNNKETTQPSIHSEISKLRYALANLPPKTRNPTTTQDREQALTIKTFHTLQEQWLNQNKALTQATTPSTNLTQNGQMLVQSLLNKKGPTTGGQQKSGIQPQREISSSSDISIPWILELPFKIIDYFLHHKITAVIIGFASLFFFNLIFGSRS